MADHLREFAPPSRELEISSDDFQFTLDMYGRDHQQIDIYLFYLDKCDQPLPESFDNGEKIDYIIKQAKKFNLPTDFIEKLRGKVGLVFNNQEMADQIYAVALYKIDMRTAFFRFPLEALEGDAYFPLLYHELWHAYFDLTISKEDRNFIISKSQDYYSEYIGEGKSSTPLEKLINQLTQNHCNRVYELYEHEMAPTFIVDEAIGEYIQSFLNGYLRSLRLARAKVNNMAHVHINEHIKSGSDVFGELMMISPSKPIRPEIRDFIRDTILEEINFYYYDG